MFLKNIPKENYSMVLTDKDAEEETWRWLGRIEQPLVKKNIGRNTNRVDKLF